MATKFFGCMKVAMKVAGVLLVIVRGNPAVSNILTFSINRCFCAWQPLCDCWSEKGAWSADNDVTWNAIMKREFYSLSCF